MARSSTAWVPTTRVPQAAASGRAARRIARQRRAARRELPPLDLRTPSGRRTLPY